MPNCYLCNSPITEVNETKEHIILNALGGRLVSKTLICRECNSRLGDSCDTELANQLSNFCTQFGIKRHRGNLQDIIAKTSDGLEYIINKKKDGRNAMKLKNADVKIESAGEGQEYIHILASNEKQIHEAVGKFNAKNNNKLDIEKLLQHATHTREAMPSVELKLSIGGNLCFHSVLKSAVNFFIYSGFDKSIVTHSIVLINDSSSAIDNVNHYLVDCVGDDRICHLIHICTDTARHRIYAYLEYFSSFGFLILLSDNYEGEPLTASYRYDLAELKEVEMPFTLDFISDIWQEAGNTAAHRARVEQRTNNFMRHCSKRDHKNEVEAFRKILCKYIDKFFTNPPAEVIDVNLLSNADFNRLLEDFVSECEDEGLSSILNEFLDSICAKSQWAGFANDYTSTSILTQKS